MLERALAGARAVIIAWLFLCLAIAQEGLREAVEAYQRGDLSRAETLARIAVQQRPSDVGALMLLGVVLDGRKQHQEAEPFYRKALRLAPKDPAVLNNAGNHFFSVGKKKEAERLYEGVLSVQPDHPNANLQLARLHVEHGDAKRAFLCLQKLPADDPGVKVVQVQALAVSGNLKQAEQAAGNDVRVLFSAGLELAHMQRYAEAEYLFGAALITDPQNPEILYNLGLAAAKAGHRERAVSVYTTALRAKPADADVLYQLGLLYLELGRKQDAAFALGDARRAAPGRLDIAEGLARALDEAGFAGDAVKAWGEAVSLGGGDVTRREYAFAQARTGDIQAGLRGLEAYVAKHPKDATGWFQLGIALSSGDPEAALDRLGKAVALDPGYSFAWYARGAMLVEANRMGEAAAHLEKAVALDPKNALALDALGQAYRSLKRIPEAERVLRQAAALAPNDGSIHMHLGLTLRDAGKREEAAQHLDRFRALGGKPGRMAPRAGLYDLLRMAPGERQEQFIRKLRRAAEFAPNDADAQVALGNALLDGGRLEEGEAALKKAMALPSVSPQWKARAGSALLRAGRYEAARDLLQDSAEQAESRLDYAIALLHTNGPKPALAEMKLIPEANRGGDYWLVQAQMLDADGDFRGAVDALNRGLKATGTRPDLIPDAVRFLVKHDRLEEASTFLADSVKRFADEPEVHLMQAIVLELAGKTEQAEAVLAHLEQRWPEWERPWAVHGMILTNRLRAGEAMRYLETALALGADSAEVYYYMADALVKNGGNLESAREWINRSLARDAEDPYAHALLGRIELDRKRPTEAAKALERAIALAPEFGRAHTLLSQAYFQVGRKEDAAREAAEAKRLAEGQRESDPAPPAKQRLFGAGSSGRTRP